MLLQLLFGVVALDHVHDLHGFDERLDVVRSLRKQALAQLLQPVAKLTLLVEHGPRALEVLLDEAQGAPALVRQALPGLLQGEAQPGQPHDAGQPLEVGPGVQAVPGVGPLRGHQEADVLVVVQGPHRDSGPPRQVADLEGHLAPGPARPSAFAIAHEKTVRPDVA